MIDYQRDQQQTIPDSQVKIIGVGGAGANMIDRVALDGMEGAELMALNTDSRTLASSVASEKIQLGVQLTKGLGSGGDPELGLQAAQEVETEIRDAMRERKMVFVCVGLGGGTGSGAAPLVTRIAREMGAFVVVFATMPFEFEGRRRREQAETALNELSVIANALVTFDNTRMGELVLAAQGIHDAFAAADRMISESIRAVTRLVIRPGIINVGLDDLMTALRSTRSRCLFGSGIAQGQNRSQTALKNALNSPLLDKGRLLKNTQTALVHICGGDGMTLYEVELLMRELTKHVPKDAHILFGAAVDETMGDSLSVTIISSLPESQLHSHDATEIDSAVDEPEREKVMEPSTGFGVVSAGEVLEVEGDEEEDEEEIVEGVLEEEDDVEDDDEGELEEDEDIEEEELDDADEDDSDADEDEEDEEESAEIDDEVVIAETLAEEQAADLALEQIAAGKKSAGQAELELDGGPRGKFEGEAPNLLDGEDLDIPPFLRKKG